MAASSKTTAFSTLAAGHAISDGMTMRDATRIDYAGRVDRVLAHLESFALDDGAPSLEALAGIAALSPHHFHCVYRLMVGETIGETVRRIRLARTVPALRRPDVSVTIAAAASGYATARPMRARSAPSSADPRAPRAAPMRQRTNW